MEKYFVLTFFGGKKDQNATMGGKRVLVSIYPDPSKENGVSFENAKNMLDPSADQEIWAARQVKLQLPEIIE